MYDKLIVGSVAIGSAVVAGAAGYVGRKLHKLSKKVGLAVDDLTNAEADDIRQGMIELSVQKAADREVKKYAREAADEALLSIRGEVKSQVKKAVNDAFEDVKKAVTEEITTQVSAIDHKALQKDVVKKAEQKILEKFDSNLDDILKDFSDNLDRVKKIYSSISDTLSERKSGKEIRLNLG